MITSLSSFEGYKVKAADGEVGEVVDYIFDDYAWAVRYLVVLSGSWLNRRNLLFSPAAMQLSPSEDDSFSLDISTEMIEKSPPLDSEQPLSRDQEAALNQYYGWPIYWSDLNMASYPLVEMVTELREKTGDDELEQENLHLRSLEQVKGYQIEARDGSIGRIDDLLVDASNWKILYLVVDTGDWLTGRKVLLSPSWIQEINWEDLAVLVDLSRETIGNSPEYDPEQPLERDYEEKLYEHYQREKYW